MAKKIALVTQATAVALAIGLYRTERGVHAATTPPVLHVTVAGTSYSGPITELFQAQRRAAVGWGYFLEVVAQTTTHKIVCSIYASSRSETDSLRAHILDGHTTEVSCDVANSFVQGTNVNATVDITPNATSMQQGDQLVFIAP
jgi:hypothetical protein